MKAKRIFLLLTALCLAVLLCACSGKKDGGEYYSVTLQAEAGSGYFWECSLSAADIVTVEPLQEETKELEAGSIFNTEFRFYGKSYGTVTADFRCCQSWDETVVYLRSCELSVDKDNAVTGELSQRQVAIAPGAADYSLTMQDNTLAIWNVDENGTYIFTPQHEGSTLLTFTRYGESETDVMKREFYLTVTEDGEISVTEDNALQGVGGYDSVELLEDSLGFPMPLPEEAELVEASRVGELAFVDFMWRDLEFAYVGGEMDVDDFFAEDARVLNVRSVQIGVLCDGGMQAGWELNGYGYYIVCDEILSDSYLQELMGQILEDEDIGVSGTLSDDGVQIRKLQ